MAMASPCSSLSEKPAHASAHDRTCGEVEQHALARLVSSRATIAALPCTATLMARVSAPHPCNTPAVLLQPGEIGGVAEETVLGGPPRSRRNSRGGPWRARGSGQHEARLVEGAHQVLALGHVDRGSCRRRRNRPAPAASSASARRACGGAPCWRRSPQIADHAAAQRDHAVAALEAHLEQASAQGREGRKAFVASPGGRISVRMEARGPQARLERGWWPRRHSDP